MIGRAPVTAGVLAVLRTVWADVGDNIAPGAPEGAYAVLEHGGGDSFDDGDVEDPESERMYRFRVRSVSPLANSDGTGSRVSAETLADRLEARILDRTQAIAGSGWRAGQRALTDDAGVLREGNVANVVRGYELWVVHV